MPEIPLTQGQVAIVDDVDYEFLMQWKWCANNHKGTYRAMRNTSASKSAKSVSHYMHRVIAERMGILAPSIDHKDRDTMNNRRSNLRAATVSQQNHNQGRRRDNTSGYKGVYWSKPHKKWRPYVTDQGRKHYFGLFDDPAEAYEAYKKKKLELAGKFSPEEIQDA